MNNWRVSFSFFFILILMPMLPAQEGIGSPQDEARYFRSNSLGMALEEISSFQKDDYPYVLKRRSEKDFVEDVLLREGKPYNRAEYEWKTGIKYSRFYEKDVLKRESIETDGRIQEERIFDTNGEPLRRVYQWQEGELVNIKTLVQNNEKEKGERLDEYVRGKNGNLLQVIRTENRAATEVADIFSSPLKEESRVQWHFAEEGLSYFFYTRDDQEITERYRNGDMVYRKRLIDKKQGIRKEEEYPKLEKEIHTEINEDGKIVSSRIRSPEGTVIEKFRYEDGLLVERLREGTGGAIRVVYTHGEGRRADEKVYEDDVLKKEINYYGDEGRREILYRQGEPIVKIEYEGEEIVERTSLLKDSR